MRGVLKGGGAAPFFLVLHTIETRYIAIEGVKLDVRTSRLLRETLDIRAGIYTIYLVELDRADDGFRALVKEGGIVIYEAG